MREVGIPSYLEKNKIKQRLKKTEGHCNGSRKYLLCMCVGLKKNLAVRNATIAHFAGGGGYRISLPPKKTLKVVCMSTKHTLWVLRFLVIAHQSP